MLLPYDPVIMVLDIYSNELKAMSTQKSAQEIFIAVLFFTAKTWTQPRLPSVGEWIN